MSTEPTRTNFLTADTQAAGPGSSPAPEVPPPLRRWSIAELIARAASAPRAVGVPRTQSMSHC